MSKMNMWIKCGLYIVILGVWLELWKKFEEVMRVIVFDEELDLKIYAGFSEWFMEESVRIDTQKVLMKL